MQYFVYVAIERKEAILDPQGKAVEHALGNMDNFVRSIRSSIPMYSPDGKFVPGAVETAYQVLKVFDPAVAGATIDLKKTYNETFVQKALTN